MTFNEYEQTFLDILAGRQTDAPYNKPDYVNYIKLNWSRQQRWLKIGVLNPELIAAIKNITHEQTWTVITAPWCGDSAHTLPFIRLLSQLNPLIKADYQLRDAEPFLINDYLTNGTKSIPKLIIKEGDNTIAVWGPRPAACQLLYEQLIHGHHNHEEATLELQQWYNADKGASFQRELLGIITTKTN